MTAPSIFEVITGLLIHHKRGLVGAVQIALIMAYVMAGSYIWANKVLLPPAAGSLPADTTRGEVLR